MRRDCDHHFSNRGYSLQFWPGSQSGMDCLTETASLGDDISLDWITIIYRINDRSGNPGRPGEPNIGQPINWMAEQVYDFDLQFVAGNRCLANGVC